MSMTLRARGVLAVGVIFFASVPDGGAQLPLEPASLSLEDVSVI